MVLYKSELVDSLLRWDGNGRRRQQSCSEGELVSQTKHRNYATKSNAKSMENQANNEKQVVEIEFVRGKRSDN